MKEIEYLAMNASPHVRSFSALRCVGILQYYRCVPWCTSSASRLSVCFCSRIVQLNRKKPRIQAGVLTLSGQFLNNGVGATGSGGVISDGWTFEGALVLDKAAVFKV